MLLFASSSARKLGAHAPENLEKGIRILSHFSKKGRQQRDMPTSALNSFTCKWRLGLDIVQTCHDSTMLVRRREGIDCRPRDTEDSSLLRISATRIVATTFTLRCLYRDPPVFALVAVWLVLLPVGCRCLCVCVCGVRFYLRRLRLHHITLHRFFLHRRAS